MKPFWIQFFFCYLLFFAGISSLSQAQEINFEEKKSLQKARSLFFSKNKPEKQIALGFGPSFFNQMNNSGAGLGFVGAYIWNISGYADMGLQTDLALSPKHLGTHIITGKVVVYGFFSPTDISPFLGGGFGYGYAQAHDPDNSLPQPQSNGFALSLKAGMKFFRSSTKNLGLELEYTLLADQNSIGSPGVLSIKLNFYY